jgi:hypothetical protein
METDLYDEMDLYDSTISNIKESYCIKIIFKDPDSEAIGRYLNKTQIQKESIYYIIKEDKEDKEDDNFENITNFKNALDSLNPSLLYSTLNSRFYDAIRLKYEFESEFDFDIKLLKFKDKIKEEFKDKKIVFSSDGGKKGGVKYTVKQLQAIASKNNIKITKKVDGKTVRLNKKGLMTKLKRYQLI